jgi:hypothetical protein
VPGAALIAARAAARFAPLLLAPVTPTPAVVLAGCARDEAPT